MISLELPAPTDKWIIFNERNQLEVRQNSKCSQKIDPTTHPTWWRENYSKILMLSNLLENVGYIHLDGQQDWPIISILVYKNHRQKGYAKEALQLLLKNKPKANIIAEVLPHNIASHHLFSDAGFIQYAPGLYIHRSSSANWSFG